MRRAATIGIGLAVALVAVAGGLRLATGPWPGPPQVLPAADRVVVSKSERRLSLMRAGQPLRSYRVSLGTVPAGHKQHEGDKRTPEGQYVLDWRNPQSRYHLSLHVSYPDSADIARAAASGVRPGGNIMIHGLPNGYGWVGAFHRLRDWTAGCIAVTDEEIEEIYAAVADGTPIIIEP